MAFNDLQIATDLYIARESQLTKDLTGILSVISDATHESVEIAKDTQQKRNAVKKEYKVGTEAYKDAMADIQADYDLSLAQLSAWESELQAKKTAKEAELKETTGLKETTQAEAQKEAESDMKFAQNK